MFFNWSFSFHSSLISAVEVRSYCLCFVYEFIYGLWFSNNEYCRHLLLRCCSWFLTSYNVQLVISIAFKRLNQLLREIVRINGAYGIAILLFSECFYGISAYFAFNLSCFYLQVSPQSSYMLSRHVLLKLVTRSRLTWILSCLRPCRRDTVAGTLKWLR